MENRCGSNKISDRDFSTDVYRQRGATLFTDVCSQRGATCRDSRGFTMIARFTLLVITVNQFSNLGLLLNYNEKFT